MGKRIEDSYSSCVIHGFTIEDNPKIEMIRITTVNTDCDNMFDLDYEYNYFLDYKNRDLLIGYLASKGYYHGDLYDAMKSRYGEYLERGLPYFDWEENGIAYMQDCYYSEPSKSKYADFVNYKSKDEFERIKGE